VTATVTHRDFSTDEMLPKAWDVIRKGNRASTSLIQRRLSLGYNRAAGLLAELERRGYVGKEHGADPRVFLVSLDMPFTFTE
jgi:DNA segregation ATPase FtsK/SpoIIIE, S-DNA-T family